MLARERLMCESPDSQVLRVRWSFLGGVVFRGRYIRLFFMWVDSPLVHHQIVDLEDIVSLLKFYIKSVSKQCNRHYGCRGAKIQPVACLFWN